MFPSNSRGPLSGCLKDSQAMLSTLLLLTAPLASNDNVHDGHARLHPPSAEFFVELPALLPFLKETGWDVALELLANPDFREGMEEALGEKLPEPADFGTWIQTKLEREAEVPADIWPLFKGLNSVSISLSGVMEAPTGYEQQIEALELVQRDLKGLKYELEQYALDHGGEYPEHLSSLPGLSLGTPKDIWGNAYHYSTQGGGKWFSLYSMGSDGVPDGAQLAADISAHDSLDEQMAAIRFGSLAAVVALEFDQPNLAEATGGMLSGLSRESGAHSVFAHSGENMLGDAVHWELFSDYEGSSNRWWVLSSGSVTLVGFGQVDPEQSMLRAEGAEPGLAHTKLYKRAGSSVVGAKSAPLLRGFDRFSGPNVVRFLLSKAPEIEGIVSALETGRQPEGVGKFVSDLAMASMGPESVWGLWLEEGGITWERSTPSAEPSSVLPFMNVPIEFNLRNLVPDQAAGVVHGSLDGQQLFAWAYAGMRIGMGAQATQLLAEIEAKAKVSVREDLIENLGTEWIAFFPPVSGLTPPRFQGWCEIKDVERFSKAVASLHELAVEYFGEDQPFESRDYRNAQIYNFELGIPFVEPAFAVVEDKLFFAITPSLIKSRLRGRTRLGSDFTYEGHHMYSGLVEAERKVSGLSYFDWADLLAGYYDAGRSMLGLFAPQFSLPFDAEQLPEPDFFYDYFDPSICVNVTGEAITHVRWHAEF